MYEDLETIISHFGLNNQIKKLNEEVFEVTEALLTDDGSEEAKEHITEEIADVLVLINQIIVNKGISTEKIDDMMNYKVSRTLKRIKEDYYG